MRKNAHPCDYQRLDRGFHFNEFLFVYHIFAAASLPAVSLPLWHPLRYARN